MTKVMKSNPSKVETAVHGSQDDQWAGVVDLTPDDLDGAFSALMNKCSQESTDAGGFEASQPRCQQILPGS